jgi:hypothetical protein
LGKKNIAKHMNFKPSDFFIGLMDFFSVFLPGFIVAFLFRTQLQYSLKINMSDGASLTAFYFVSSYILGHFVYAVGASVFESAKMFGERHIMYTVFLKRNRIKKAVEIMKKYLGPDDEIHFLSWAVPRIQIKHPELVTDIRQHQADAHFFRSFIIVSIIGFILAILRLNKDLSAWFWFSAALLSTALYYYRKYKAFSQASDVIATMFY